MRPVSHIPRKSKGQRVAIGVVARLLERRQHEILMVDQSRPTLEQWAEAEEARVDGAAQVAGDYRPLLPDDP